MICTTYVIFFLDNDTHILFFTVVKRVLIRVSLESPELNSNPGEIILVVVMVPFNIMGLTTKTEMALPTYVCIQILL